MEKPQTVAESEIAELQAIYESIAEAFERRDLDGVMKFIGPDWEGEANGKIVTREDLKGHVEGQFRDLTDIHWPRTVSLPRADGDRLTVRAAGIYRARKAGSGEPVEMDLTNDDTWVRTDSGWQNVHSRAIL
jgi:hypothetical protein